MNRTTDAAIARLEATLPAGVVIEEISRGSSSGSRDAEGQYKEGVGSYLENLLTGWCVEATGDGWEYERERYFQWGATIREACLRLAWSLRRVARNPHLQHLGLEGPGEVTFEAYFLRSCPECVREAEDIFDGEVDWDDEP